jgi:hypothetical protein
MAEGNAYDGKVDDLKGALALMERTVSTFFTLQKLPGSAADVEKLTVTIGHLLEIVYRLGDRDRSNIIRNVRGLPIPIDLSFPPHEKHLQDLFLQIRQPNK